VLSSIHDAVPGLIVLVAGAELSNGLENKIVYFFVPSLGALEGIAVKDTITELNMVQNHIERINAKISTCVKALAPVM
jgi:hypothetical protein